MAALGLGQVLGSLDGARHVLLAGAGGGHDVYAAVPLWWHLRAAGVRVSLASLSFTDGVAMGPEVAEGVACHRVTPEATLIGETFGELAFPELHLARWLATQGADAGDAVVWTMPAAGLVPFRGAYQWLHAQLGFDAVVLVDGGNDSLMTGGEHGLGTVAEDGVSMVAAAGLDVERKLLVCAGLGTDARHGVGLADTFESIAELTRLGAWRGACALTAGDPGVDAMVEAVAAANAAQSSTSTVANAIVAAAQGRFGRVETGTRGNGDSTVWVNPLLAMYWAFHLDSVVARLDYAPVLEGTETIGEAIKAILGYRRQHPSRPQQRIPM
jgi:hypothetical protein